MRQIFWGFCINWFLIDPFHYLSSCSDFGFEFTDISVIEKRLPDSAFECLKENSPHWWTVKSHRSRLGESGRCYGDETGSRYSIFYKFIINLQNFKRLNQPFKGSLVEKKPGIGLKKIVSIGNLVDFLTWRVGESFLDYEYLCEFKAKIGTEMCTGPMPNWFIQKPQKIRLIAMSL